MKVLVIIFLYLALFGEENSITADTGSTTCNFPALFNFGDSNSDTGGAYTYFHNINWPNGITFGKLFKRNRDGRLIIDFFAESLGFPHLNASADTNGTSFRYGANFAVGGSRLEPQGARPNTSVPLTGLDFPLDEQVTRFFDFKSRAIDSKEPESINMYPKAEAFPEALCTIDIGQNDVNALFQYQPVSKTLDYFTNSVQRLLDNGAKYMWVHNTCPLGCLPFAVQSGCPLRWSPTCTREKSGCIMEYNAKSQEFNSELKLRIDLLREKYPDAVITLVDMYSAKYQLILNPQGFDDALKFKICCGDSFLNWCGTGNSTACLEPSKYLNWDGKHWTEAANRILAKQIGEGAFSEPRVGLSNACERE